MGKGLIGAGLECVRESCASKAAHARREEKTTLVVEKETAPAALLRIIIPPCCFIFGVGRGQREWATQRVDSIHPTSPKSATSAISIQLFTI